MRADAGDPEAMVKLGKKFFSGDGVKKNRCKAEKYFKKAALENCAEAYVELGKLYQTGYAYGNGELAEELWTKAVSLGSAEAAYLIGRLYYQAGRVPRNKDKAEQWYKIAVEKGYAPALYELGDIYLSQYEGRAQESLALFEKAAEGGVAEAYLKLAELYGYNFADRPDSAKVSEDRRGNGRERSAARIRYRALFGCRQRKKRYCGFGKSRGRGRRHSYVVTWRFILQRTCGKARLRQGVLLVQPSFR